MNNSFIGNIYRAFMAMLLFTIILGVIYTFVIMGIGQLAFNYQANGSLIKENGRVIGSELIQQKFTGDKYFHGRPASFSADDYPTSKKMIKGIQQKALALKGTNSSRVAVPVELVADSGSGVDPDISPDAAYFQVNRISNARNIPKSAIKKLIDESIEGPSLFIFGQSHVNVLKLNMALDHYSKSRS